MKKVLACAATVLVLSTAATAMAASFPVTLTVDSSSGITINVAAGGLVLTGTAKSGTWNTTITQTGTAPPAVDLSSVSGSLSLNDASGSGSLGTASLIGGHITLNPGGPFPNTTASNPGTLDLGGMTVNLDGGIINASLFGGLLTLSSDLGASPVNNVTFPPGTTASINEVPLGGGSYHVTVSSPISITSNIPVPGFGSLPLSITGLLSFSGTKVVPEPGSMFLMVLGLAGVGLKVIRRRRK
jgi:hypothetical protein